MKKTSLLLMLCIQVALFGGILEKGYEGVYCAITGSAKTYDFKKAGKNITNIGFSLNNKSDSAVYFRLVNGNIFQRLGQNVTQPADLLIKNAVAEAAIDVSNVTELTLYNTKGVKILTAHFAPEKTIYINWDGKTLYKQKGPLGGITGVNDNCFSLANNVADSDITIIRP